MAMHYGSLLPDIDIPHSIASSIIPAHYILKHGGITHTIAFSLIFIALYIYSWHPFWLGLWFGYVFAHLLPDHLQGNPLKYLWWPFDKKKRRKK